MSTINSNFISRYRLAVLELFMARDKLSSLRREYDAGDLGNNLNQANDFTGDNQEILKADFVAAVGSVAAIENFIATNFHDSNLYKVKRVVTL